MLILETLVLTAGPSSLPRMCEQRKCIGRNASVNVLTVRHRVASGSCLWKDDSTLVWVGRRMEEMQEGRWEGRTGVGITPTGQQP